MVAIGSFLVLVFDIRKGKTMNKSFLSFACVYLMLAPSTFALKIGEDAPNFSAVDSNGKTWQSSSFLGKKHLVVYFYPAAMTGGCTKQACSYSEHKEEWESNEVEVVGISGDSPENLKVFKKAESLKFTLLSDLKGKIAKAFGVPTSKGGRIERLIEGEKVTLERGVTTKRWTFLVSKKGKILYINSKVNAAQDSRSLLTLFQEKSFQ